MTYVGYLKDYFTANASNKVYTVTGGIVRIGKAYIVSFYLGTEDIANVIDTYWELGIMQQLLPSYPFSAPVILTHNNKIIGHGKIQIDTDGTVTLNAPISSNYLGINGILMYQNTKL